MSLPRVLSTAMYSVSAHDCSSCKLLICFFWGPLARGCNLYFSTVKCATAVVMNLQGMDLVVRGSHAKDTVLPPHGSQYICCDCGIHCHR